MLGVKIALLDSALSSLDRELIPATLQEALTEEQTITYLASLASVRSPPYSVCIWAVCQPGGTAFLCFISRA